MKALNLHAVNDLRYEDVALPTRSKDEATVQIKAVGICGSDIPRIFEKGTYHFPTIPGHEFSGVVVDANDKSLLNKHVAVFPLIPCGDCAFCQIGEYQLCDHYDYYGSRRDGGYAEYLNVKLNNLVFLPESLPFEFAAMCEPASVALHALRRGNMKAMDTLAIWGVGPIGLLLGMWGRIMGAKNIVLVARDNIKVQFAKELGFQNAINSQVVDPVEYIHKLTHGKGADICVEGTGSSTPFSACLHGCKKLGTVVCMGNPSAGMELDQASYWAILRKQLTLKGTWNSSFNQMQNDWQDTIHAMASGALDVKPLITHRFTFEQYREAFDVMKSKEIFSCKVMFIND
jgi:L-iditol 2-dehydrogenase